jgi:hypothetical protein
MVSAMPVVAEAAKPKLSDSQKELLRTYINARRKAAEANKVVEQVKDAALSAVRLLGGRAILYRALLLESEAVSYDYPAAIRRREEALKNDKKIMQLDGRAQKIVKPCLTFKDLATD